MANRSRMLALDLEGMPELLAKLKSIPVKLEKRELKKAVGKASQFVLKVARQKAPWGRGVAPGGRPRQHLRDTLGKKVKQYKKAAVGVVGPFYRKAPHAHLVHDGTRPHEITLPAGKSFRIDGGALMRGPRVFKNPGAKANPFLMEAWQQSRSPCLGAMTKSFKDFFRNQDKENANLYGGG